MAAAEEECLLEAGQEAVVLEDVEEAEVAEGEEEVVAEAGVAEVAWRTVYLECRARIILCTPPSRTQASRVTDR